MAHGNLPPAITPSRAERSRPDFVPHILDVMRTRGLNLRALTPLCGLTRSRLGLLLHRDPAKRSEMTLHQLQLILDALGIDLMQALVRCDAMEAVTEPDNSARYMPLITMLAKLFHDLPRTIVLALEEIQDMDGTEVRPEWAPALQRAVVKRVVHEISAVTQRRSTLSDFSIF